jgi:hypothetical protein
MPAPAPAPPTTTAVAVAVAGRPHTEFLGELLCQPPAAVFAAWIAESADFAALPR